MGWALVYLKGNLISRDWVRARPRHALRRGAANCRIEERESAVIGARVVARRRARLGSQSLRLP
jgi:hypothetical protein